MSPNVAPVTAMYRPSAYSSTEPPPPTVIRLPCGSPANSPDVQPVAGPRDLDPRSRRSVDDGLRPGQRRALHVEAVVEVEAHDAVAVEDEPEPGARRRARGVAVARPARRVHTRCDRAADRERDLVRGVPDPARPVRQLVRDRAGRTVSCCSARRLAVPRVPPGRERHRLGTVLAVTPRHDPMISRRTLSAR